MRATPKWSAFVSVRPDLPILVLGATGKTGRRVAARLRARGIPVRAGSRTAAVPFDWEAPGTWPRALEGCGAAYVAYQPDLAVPGADADIGQFVARAADAGVRRLVLLSGRGEPEAARCEDLVRASGLDWTILRASWFAQNFSEGLLRDEVLRGELALPVGEVPEPFIDIDDLAEIAVDALLDARHVGASYDLTGPRALTFADAAAELQRAIGRPVRLARLAPETYAARLARAGVPAGTIDFLVYLFTTVLDGRNAAVTDGVRRALGRPARDFGAFAQDAAAAGVWDRAAAPASA